MQQYTALEMDRLNQGQRDRWHHDANHDHTV